MNQKQNRYLHLLLLTLILVLSGTAQAESVVSEINPIERCKSEDNYRCAGQCKDGWSSHCYYDSSRFKIESNLAIELQKDRCFGFYYESTCEPCKRLYQLSSNAGLKEVTCSEFYSGLISKDRECDGCLRYDFGAGG